MSQRRDRKRWILISVVIVIIAGAYIAPSVILFDKEDISGSMEIIVPVVTCITAGISTLLTGINIVEARKLHLEDRQSAVLTRWYNELVLDKHLDDIRNFFSTCDKLVVSLEKANGRRSKITGGEYDSLVQKEVANPFTVSFTRIHRDLVLDLSLINRELSISVSTILQTLQDDFFRYLESTHVDYSKMRELIKNCNNSIMKELMAFNKKTSRSSALSAWINE